MNLAHVLALCLVLTGCVCAESTVWKQEPVWSYRIPGKVNSAVALQSSILVGAENGIYMMDYSKALKWFSPTGGSVMSIKAVDENDIVIASSDGQVKLLRRNGTTAWERPIPGYVGYDRALSSDGTRIVCGSMDGYVYAFDMKGTYLWKHLVGSYVMETGVSGDDLIAISDRQVYILDLEGRVRRNLDITGYVRSSRVLNGTILVGMDDGSLYAYGMNGTLLWKSNISEFVSAVSGEGNITVGTREGHIIQLSPGGRLLWKRNATGGVTSLGYTGEYIIAGTQDSRVTVYSLGGLPLWYHETDGRASVISAQGSEVVSGTTTGYIYYTKLVKKEADGSLVITVAAIVVIAAAMIMMARSWR